MSLSFFQLPFFCSIEKIDFENSYVVIKNYKFIDNIPSEQEYIRVTPEENHKISLFFDERKIHADVKIIDIGIGGAKVALSLIPPGFKEGDKVIVDMVFTSGAKPLIINTKAKVVKLTEEKREFVVVLLLNNDANIKKLLTAYIANRQMALIREFKNLSL